VGGKRIHKRAKKMKKLFCTHNAEKKRHRGGEWSKGRADVGVVAKAKLKGGKESEGKRFLGVGEGAKKNAQGEGMTVKKGTAMTRKERVQSITNPG